MAIDTASVLSAILDGSVAAVSVAVAWVAAGWALKAARLIRDGGDDDYSEDDDLRRYTHDQYYAECPKCGVNSIDDESIFDHDFHSDACPQCGADLDMEEI
jgi:hypothetical protein